MSGQDETTRNGVCTPFHPDGKAIADLCRVLLDLVVLLYGPYDLCIYGVPSVLHAVLLDQLVLLSLVPGRQKYSRIGRKKVPKFHCFSLHLC